MFHDMKLTEPEEESDAGSEDGLEPGDVEEEKPPVSINKHDRAIKYDSCN